MVCTVRILLVAITNSVHLYNVQQIISNSHNYPHSPWRRLEHLVETERYVLTKWSSSFQLPILHDHVMKCSIKRICSMWACIDTQGKRIIGGIICASLTSCASATKSTKQRWSFQPQLRNLALKIDGLGGSKIKFPWEAYSCIHGMFRLKTRDVPKDF